MITLKMKNFNIRLIEKLQNYQPDNQEKLIYVNILQMKKYYKKHYLFSFGKSFGKNNKKQLKNKKKNQGEKQIKVIKNRVEKGQKSIASLF